MPAAVTTLRETATVPEAAATEQQYILEAHGLHRVIGNDTIVNNISLSLCRGDALGLLGLNGAGKSTTLKMLCGMLVPDEGTVTVNGHSMSEQPLLTRAQIGFLPDQPPLYNDMRVSEYLRLCGQIRGLKGSALSARMTSTIEQCSLGDVRKKLIATLSKGYRQRVGLAQAIIHQPALLLLDEPSNGLDPQQLESMRKLIRNYAEEHAVVFSTHLLAEAQTSCNRVAIIHDGKLITETSVNGADLVKLFHEAIT
ncbi:MAG: ABC transporter ATP-binding protein [Granulosicoccus sp.]